MKRMRPGLSGREHWDGDAAGLLGGARPQDACTQDLLEFGTDCGTGRRIKQACHPLGVTDPNAGRRLKTQLCTDWAVK